MVGKWWNFTPRWQGKPLGGALSPTYAAENEQRLGEDFRRKFRFPTSPFTKNDDSGGVRSHLFPPPPKQDRNHEPECSHVVLREICYNDLRHINGRFFFRHSMLIHGSSSDRQHESVNFLRSAVQCSACTPQTLAVLVTENSCNASLSQCL